MDLHRSAALLGFYGDDLDPHEITSLLGVEPTVGVAKGGKWSTSTGAAKIAYTGSWRLEAPDCEPADLNSQIEAVLAAVSDDLAIWRWLTDRFRGVIFCGLWLKTYNEGLELSARSLAALGERGLVLDMDIYSMDQGA